MNPSNNNQKKEYAPVDNQEEIIQGSGGRTSPYYEHSGKTSTLCTQSSNQIQFRAHDIVPTVPGAMNEAIMLNPNVYQNPISFPTIPIQYPYHVRDQDYPNYTLHSYPPQQMHSYAPMIFSGSPDCPHHQNYQQPFNISFGNASVMQSGNQPEASSAARNDNRVITTFPPSVTLSMPSSSSYVQHFSQQFNNVQPPQPTSIMSNQEYSASSEALSSSHRTLSASQQLQQQQVTLQDLRSVLHLTTEQAAQQLGMNLATFTKVCIDNNIIMWPHRQIYDLRNRMQYLEHLVSTLGAPNHNTDINSLSDKRESYLCQIRELRSHIEYIKDQAMSASVSRYHSNEGVHPSTNKDGASSRRSYPPSSTTGSSSPTNLLNSTVDNNQKSCLSAVKKKRKRRHDTTYDHRTGWIANCSNCGKVGKYRHPSAGRGFQHTSGGKYCGYYLINPRREGQCDDTTCEQKIT